MKLSTNIHTVDVKDILANATNRAYWEKKWYIFEYDNISAVLTLDEINIRRNQVQMRIDMKNSNIDDLYYSHDYNWFTLPLDQYNPEVFRNRLMSAIRLTIYYFERYLARETDEYREIREREIELRNDHRNELIEFLNDEGIENEEVREAYIDKHLKSFSEESDGFVESYEGVALEHVHNMVDLIVKIKE